MKYIFFVFSLLLSVQAVSQNLEQDLVAYFSFNDSCAVVENFGNPTILVFENNTDSCTCGVQKEALHFDGIDSWFLVFGSQIENDVFSTRDFSISFYFRPPADDTPKSLALIDHRTGCESTNAFAVRFNPFTKNLTVDLNESSTVTGTVFATLPSTSCWYHITIVRNNTNTILYVNGEEAATSASSNGQRVDLTNNLAQLSVGMSDCLIDSPFEGLMDELRFYKRALKQTDIDALYVPTDRIGNGKPEIGVKDTTIFLGHSVQSFITSTCADEFLWTPTEGIMSGDEFIANPLLSPTVSTTYTLTLKDNFCISSDTFRVNVVDPDSLDCTVVFLPDAFTPNDDGLNDTYGISNPFVLTNLISFEIYDRWGNRVFATNDPFMRWDGTYKNSKVNAGVFLYKVQFICKGEELSQSGSITILR